MGLSRYDPRNRYRQRSQQRLTTITGLLLVGLIGGGVGYAVGYQSAHMDQNSMKAELQAAIESRDELQQTVTRLMADSHSATIKYQQIEEQMQTELPQEGPMKDIVSQIREQLDAGVDADRLANVIRTMAPPKNCTDAEIKRFIVQTPKNMTADSTVVIADGQISVKASGESAKNKSGKDESWYDPARPVALTFQYTDAKGPQTIERKNNLPISQVVVVGKKEYRMTFTDGAKSFIKMSFDSCDYP